MFSVDPHHEIVYKLAYRPICSLFADDELFAELWTDGKRKFSRSTQIFRLQIVGR